MLRVNQIKVVPEADLDTLKKKTAGILGLKPNDIEKIKMISKRIDPESFIIVTDAREVYGLGFK